MFEKLEPTAAGNVQWLGHCGKLRVQKVKQRMNICSIIFTPRYMLKRTEKQELKQVFQIDVYGISSTINER